MTATNQAVNGVRDALAAHQLAVVVGTGVTVAATNNAPTSTWKGLVGDGIGEYKASCARRLTTAASFGRGRTPSLRLLPGLLPNPPARLGHALASPGT